MYRPENIQTQAANHEAQEKLVLEYDQIAEELAWDHQGRMRGVARAHMAGATYWSNRGHDRLRFEEVLTAAPGEVARATEEDGSKIEELFENMSAAAERMLSPGDRRVLRDAKRVAKKEGTDRAGYATHDASTHEAGSVINAALDIDRLHEVRALIKEHGPVDNSVTLAINSGSSYGAQRAISAAADGARFRKLQELVKEFGMDAPEVDRAINGYDAASSDDAMQALSSGLNWERLKEAERLASKYGRDDYRVAAILDAVPNNYYVRPSMVAAMEVGKVPKHVKARAVGRQALKGILPSKPGGKKKAQRSRTYFGGWDEDPWDEFLERAWFAGEWPFEGEGPRYSSKASGTAGGEGPHDAPPTPATEGPDPYAVLGVDRGASQEEIKMAYRKLVREHHTDVGGDEEVIKGINAANDMIGNPKKRAYFDQHGHLRGYDKSK